MHAWTRAERLSSRSMSPRSIKQAIAKSKNKSKPTHTHTRKQAASKQQAAASQPTACRLCLSLFSCLLGWLVAVFCWLGRRICLYFFFRCSLIDWNCLCLKKRIINRKARPLSSIPSLLAAHPPLSLSRSRSPFPSHASRCACPLCIKKKVSAVLPCWQAAASLPFRSSCLCDMLM